MNLTPKQKEVTRKLVNTDKQQPGEELPWCDATFGSPSNVQLDDGTTIPATSHDLFALANQHLISFDYQRGMLQILQAAYDAVASNFGESKFEMIMDILQKRTKGKPGTTVPWKELVEATGLEHSEIHGHCCKGLDAGLLHMHTGGVFLSTRGLVWEADDSLPAISLGGLQISNSTIGAVHTGPNSQSFVTQNLAMSDSDLLAKMAALQEELIAGLAEALPQELEGIRSDLAEIRQEVESPTPDTTTVEKKAKGIGQKLIGAWKICGDVADSSLKVQEALEKWTPWALMLLAWAQRHQ